MSKISQTEIDALLLEHTPGTKTTKKKQIIIYTECSYCGVTSSDVVIGKRCSHCRSIDTDRRWLSRVSRKGIL
jgi:hypothetical protein